MYEICLQRLNTKKLASLFISNEYNITACKLFLNNITKIQYIAQNELFNFNICWCFLNLLRNHYKPPIKL